MWATTSAEPCGRSASSCPPRGCRRWSVRPRASSTRSPQRSSPTSSLRTGAYASLGLARLDPDRLAPHALLLLERSLSRLAAAYESCASEDWKWFEDALTYDNARLPQALIAGGLALDREDLTETGLEALRWLGDESGSAEARCV